VASDGRSQRPNDPDAAETAAIAERDAGGPVSVRRIHFSSPARLTADEAAEIHAPHPPTIERSKAMEIEVKPLDDAGTRNFALYATMLEVS
jgi:hypothetical protein